MTAERRLDAAYLYGLHLVDAALRARPPAHYPHAAASYDRAQGPRLLACCLELLHVLDVGELVSGPEFLEALVPTPSPVPPLHFPLAISMAAYMYARMCMQV